MTNSGWRRAGHPHDRDVFYVIPLDPDHARTAPDGQVDRDIEDPRAFGIVHAEEEDVAPGAVGQVHADGRGFLEDGKTPVAGEAMPQFRAYAQGLVVRMADGHMIVLASAWWQPPRGYATGPRTSAPVIGERRPM